ncbi:MAG: hypothetical protein R3C03_09775 [Pirellulaceae bacterium]
MKRIALIALVLFVAGAGTLQAQLTGEPRPFAPGVLKVISPDLRPEDSYSPPLQIPGLKTQSYEGNYVADAETLHGQTQQIVFYRDVWAFEFSTVGLRQIELNFRLADGSESPRTFFYLMYRVRNLGKSLSYEQVKQGLANPFIAYDLKRTDGKATDDFDTQPVSPDQFRPQFKLSGFLEGDDGEYSEVNFYDRELPEIAKSIQNLEDPNRRLHTQLEMESMDIPVIEDPADPGVWGVAIWENVNPNLDYMTVKIRGITNAYRIEFDANGSQTLKHKELQLNFWRPGDSVEQVRDNIIFGIPYSDSAQDQIDICRRFHLPGPRLNVYLKNDGFGGEAFMIGADAEIDMATLDSRAVEMLAKGEFPESLTGAFNSLGFDLATASAIKEKVPGQIWEVVMQFQGSQRQFEIRMEPEFWEKEGEGIRFVDSLDYFWTYR